MGRPSDQADEGRGIRRLLRELASDDQEAAMREAERRELVRRRLADARIAREERMNRE